MARTTDPFLTLADKEGVLYVRIYQRIRALILQGHWQPGTRLPSSRRLAMDLGVSRNTAMLAIEQLLADGLIEARSRAGVFVAAHATVDVNAARNADGAPPSLGKPPVPFELSPGAMDSFPFERWAKIQAHLWRTAIPNILYDSDRAGDLGLRKAIAAYVGPSRGMSIDPAQVVIVTGTQHALDLIASALRGGTAIVEDPGYLAGQATLALRGMDVVRIRVDGDGLDVAAAREAVSEPRLIVVSPALQFPTCAAMSEERRAALLDWADEVGAWIFEDDYDAFARFDQLPPTRPLREERSGRVITNLTFNRLLFRSLRLGFMILPDELRDGVLGNREATDESMNLPNQLVLQKFIEEGNFTAHLRRCRDFYQERRNALLAALHPYAGRLFERKFNTAGLHLVARPIGVPADTLAKALREAGIACWTLGQLSKLPDAPQGLLLGFAAFSPDVIEATIPALHQVFETFADNPCD